MKDKPKTFASCLRALGSDKQATLQEVRRLIRTAAPHAVEGVSYGLPAFIVNGKALAGLGATTDQCTYYPMSGSVIAALAADLKKYDTSKGAIRFPVGKPLPGALVRKLLKARLAEINPPTEKAAVKRPTKK